MKRAGPIALVTLALAACATIVPDDLRGVVNREVSGERLIAAPERHRGEVVMVGGDIIQVRTVDGVSDVEVLQRPLAGEEPVLTDRSGGRFLIRHAGVLDPVEYSTGRRVTVIGTVLDPVTRQDGAHTVTWPVVESRVLKLWPRAALARSPYPYAYDPWYDPWYPYPGWWSGAYYHRFYRR
jgi:outer membrane lipoprotein